MGLRLERSFFIFVQAEEIRVSEVRFHAAVNSAIEDATEEEAQSLMGGGTVPIGKAAEDIQGVHEEAIRLTFVLALDGQDDVTRQLSKRDTRIFRYWPRGDVGAAGGGGEQGRILVGDVGSVVLGYGGNT